MESILTSIKKLLGITEEYTQFDSDIVMHINTVLMDLNGLGVGPSSGFIIEDDTSTWTDFVRDPKKLQAIKSYMYLRVKLLFDSATLSSAVIASMEKQIEKFEWLINAAAENDRSGIIDENVSEEIQALIAQLESENEELRALNDGLTTTNTALQKNVENLTTANNTLKTSNATLQANITSLSAANTVLEADNAGLRENIDTLEEINNALESDNVDLRLTNESLTERNSELAISNDTLQSEKAALESTNSELTASNESLKSDKASLEAELEELEASIKPEQEKAVTFTENGTVDVIPDAGTTLSLVSVTVDVPTSGGTEELETLIDNSEVLESTDGTVTDKVEQLIDYANFKNIIQEALYETEGSGAYNLLSVFRETSVTNVSMFDFSKVQYFKNGFTNTPIVDLEVDFTNARDANGMCSGCNSLKTAIIKNMSSKCTNINTLFNGCKNLERVETLDISGCVATSGYTSTFKDCTSLKHLRFVENCIKVSITIPSPALSDESLMSILKGLAPLEAGADQTLTVHSQIFDYLCEDKWLDAVNEMIEKNWIIE